MISVLIVSLLGHENASQECSEYHIACGLRRLVRPVWGWIAEKSEVVLSRGGRGLGVGHMRGQATHSSAIAIGERNAFDLSATATDTSGFECVVAPNAASQKIS